MEREPESILGATESVCPVCLERIPARRVAVGEDVYLEKTCGQHGYFRAIIWRGLPAYADWAVSKAPPAPPAPLWGTGRKRGCPYDCGLCVDHRQETCCVLLEVTGRCNLACPLCYAAAGDGGDDPGIDAIEGWYRLLLASGGPYNIQLSGGEPTLRDDLPELIALGRSLGFGYFQLNTNGLRLAAEPAYLRRLKQVGLSCVFLQFDGLDDFVYEKIRGAALLEIKTAAIDRCAEAGLGVVLVPTLVPGVNTGEIGRLVEFAALRMPAVRGIHFQPVSYFGRYPEAPDDRQRITLPEVMRELERQTDGRMKLGDFRPTGGRHACCSFHASYLVAADGSFKPWPGAGGRQCCEARPADGVRRARSFIARRWSAAGAARPEEVGTESLDAFLAEVESRSLCISAMAFQDAGNLDLERLKDCPLHIVHPDRRIIPFCAYNLTDGQGRSPHRPAGGRGR